MVKFQTKVKKWWKKHWDEVIFVGSISIGVYLLLVSQGII